MDIHTENNAAQNEHSGSNKRTYEKPKLVSLELNATLADTNYDKASAGGNGHNGTSGSNPGDNNIPPAS